jgi:hypothetical protein
MRRTIISKVVCKVILFEDFEIDLRSGTCSASCIYIIIVVPALTAIIVNDKRILTKDDLASIDGNLIH